MQSAASEWKYGELNDGVLLFMLITVIGKQGSFVAAEDCTAAWVYRKAYS